MLILQSIWLTTPRYYMLDFTTTHCCETEFADIHNEAKQHSI